MKTCTRCGVNWSESEFYKNNRAVDGLQYRCKTCADAATYLCRAKNASHHEKAAARARAYRSSNLEKVREDQRKSRACDPVGCLWKSCRASARKRKFDFDISIEDIVIPHLCPILGISMTLPGQGRRLNSTASVDRIDSTKGYVRGNIQVISWRANHLKSNSTHEERVALVTHDLRGKGQS